jgi:UDPglucose 6-dehydrogenase
MVNARQYLPEQVEYCADSYEAVADADALIIVTEWNQFRSLDMQRIHAGLRHPIVIDLRNIYDPQRMKDQGFDYFSVGRSATNLPFA